VWKLVCPGLATAAEEERAEREAEDPIEETRQPLEKLVCPDVWTGLATEAEEEGTLEEDKDPID
jgi:hypothetical protein